MFVNENPQREEQGREFELGLSCPRQRQLEHDTGEVVRSCSPLINKRQVIEEVATNLR